MSDLIFKDEIERIGEAAGIPGKFIFDWGTDHIINVLRNDKEIRDRAVEMLEVAAKYIRANDPEGIIYYDETECDGYCVADDCETAAEMLKYTER